MKARRFSVPVLGLAMLGVLAASAILLADVLDTGFTYQGRLRNGGEPANGNHDLAFTLYDAETLGSIVADPVERVDVRVANGAFTVPLDFGRDVTVGDPLWLEVAVRPSRGGAAYTTLTPRQRVGAPSDGPGVEGGLEGNGTPWYLTGNAGTAPGTDFLGTTDNQALEIKVNGQRALRIEPNATSPSIFAGHADNTITAGVCGATIGGGGSSGTSRNSVTDDYGTVGGGEANRAGNASGSTGDAYYATVAGGKSNTASNAFATVGGGLANSANSFYATVAGGYSNESNDNFAAVGGGSDNTATGSYATVGGGGGNAAAGGYATVGGGCGSAAAGSRATVGGGYQNDASGDYTTIGGGQGNEATHDSAAIGGGSQNDADANFSTIGGGEYNDVTGEWGTIAGGRANEATALYTSVGGGRGNTATNSYATIAGGRGNKASMHYTTVGGGYVNQATDLYATVGGGNSNKATQDCATVAGGENNLADANYTTVSGGVENIASRECAAVAGGRANTASNYYATVGGGRGNTANNNYTTIAGGRANRANTHYATVGGGYANQASGLYATVGAGQSNKATEDCSTVAGGEGNLADANYATIAGGRANTATGYYATVAGGRGNTGGQNYATVGGGRGNTANGYYATVLGGRENRASGDYSLATGYGAKVDASHDGAMVFADGTALNFTSSAANEFAARCTGGARFVSAVNGSGTPTAGVGLAPGGGSWSSMSDRNAKADFEAIDKRELLDRLANMPITTWRYKTQDASMRHIGPVAQDFHAAFGVGEDDKHITMIDADGVALGAIQGLHELLKEKDAQIAALKDRNAKLEARFAAMEATVTQLAKAMKGEAR